MVSHPETGSNSPIGSDRDRGRDNSLHRLDTFTFWWESTMCQNGLQQCPAKQQTTGWC